MTKKIYKTMQGREIDMDALLAKNETMPAVGNVKMNARGDELGAGGKLFALEKKLYQNTTKIIQTHSLQKASVVP